MTAPGESGIDYEEAPLRITLSERFDTQIAICSAVGISATMAAPMQEAESADIVHYQPNGGAGWVVPNSLVGLYINVVTRVAGSTPASAPGWDVNPYGENALDWYRSPESGSNYMYFPGVTSGSLVGNLSIGTSVGSAASFNASDISNTAFGASAGQWKLNASNYLGFRFMGADSQTRYGWLRIDVGASAGVRTIMEVAYENAVDQAILVGAVPEPSTLIMGLLATGASGVIAWRRRGQTA